MPTRQNKPDKENPSSSGAEQKKQHRVVPPVGVVVVYIFAFVTSIITNRISGDIRCYYIAAVGLCICLAHHTRHMAKLRLWGILVYPAIIFGTHIYIRNESDGHWRPPVLPKDTKQIIIYFGGCVFHYPADHPENAHPVVVNGRNMPPVYPFIENHRLYVKSRIFGYEGTFLIDEAAGKSVPLGYDGNYTSNAFEIVEFNSHKPVFQIFYQKPNEVRVNGVFFQSNSVVVAFGDGFEIATGDRAIKEIPNGVITNRAPIFKYPSWKYLHQFAD